MDTPSVSCKFPCGSFASSWLSVGSGKPNVWWVILDWLTTSRTFALLAALKKEPLRYREIRGGDTWRNLVAQLDTIKVVEYERGAARVQQTSELRKDVEALLVKLRVPLPPRLHTVEPIPASVA
jgi:hypothetical protein